MPQHISNKRLLSELMRILDHRCGGGYIGEMRYLVNQYSLPPVKASNLCRLNSASMAVLIKALGGDLSDLEND